MPLKATAGPSVLPSWLMSSEITLVVVVRVDDRADVVREAVVVAVQHVGV